MLPNLPKRAGASLLKQFNHVVEIGIARAEAPCEPVSATLGNLVTVGNYVKLTGLSRRNCDCNAEALLYEGHETRNLGSVVLSRRAMNDFDLHSILESVRRAGSRTHSCRRAIAPSMNTIAIDHIDRVCREC